MGIINIHLTEFMPSEFPKEKVSKKAEQVLGHCARLISGSKSSYHWRHPTNIVSFNANIFCMGFKIWYGDLDLTLDEVRLNKLAKALGAEIFVLYEMHGRFGEEDKATKAGIEEQALWRSNGGLKESLKRHRKECIERCRALTKKNRRVHKAIGEFPKRWNWEKLQERYWISTGAK